MALNGIEIDMLSLGDADSLLITLWENGRSTYTLIDSGYLQPKGTDTSHGRPPQEECFVIRRPLPLLQPFKVPS